MGLGTSLSLLFVFIENADATPPHLDVLLRLDGSAGVHGSLQVFAFGLLSLFSFLGRCGALRHHSVFSMCALLG